jgi:hypothetical protein
MLSITVCLFGWLVGCFWCDSPLWARASSFTRFLDRTQWRTKSVGLLWTSDQFVAETPTWQHTALTTDIHPCLRWDSNPKSEYASDRRLTTSDARPLGPASVTARSSNFADLNLYTGNISLSVSLSLFLSLSAVNLLCSVHDKTDIGKKKKKKLV